jgi:hypothetical protein
MIHVCSKRDAARRAVAQAHVIVICEAPHISTSHRYTCVPIIPPVIVMTIADSVIRIAVIRTVSFIRVIQFLS